MVLGALAGGWFMHRLFGAFLPVRTFVRVLVAMAVALVVGRIIPFTTPLMTLVEAALVGLAFLATLIATRELSSSDLRAVARVAGRKRQSGQRSNERGDA
jgi:hypothetical protein